MRRLLAPIAVLVFAAVAASCSNDEPPPEIQPTSAFRTTGSTGQTAPTGPTSTGSSGPTSATAGLPTGNIGGGGGPGKLKSGQAAFTVTGDLEASSALPTLVSAAYAPPPGFMAIVWAAGGADPSNVGLGGLSFTGTKPTSPTLTLTVTVQDKGTIATFISSAGECNVTIGQATANRVSGAFTCTNLSYGSNKVNLSGSFSAQG